MGFEEGRGEIVGVLLDSLGRFGVELRAFGFNDLEKRKIDGGGKEGEGGVGRDGYWCVHLFDFLRFDFPALEFCRQPPRFVSFAPGFCFN